MSTTISICDDDADAALEAIDLRCPLGQFPLLAVAVRATIVGVTASVELEHRFHNPYPEAVEVTYTFPLPHDAAVIGCELRGDGRVVAATLRERGAARADYQRARADGARAALVEAERQGVFSITLGSLAAGARAEIHTRLVMPLARDDGRHALRLPLVVGERYVPGRPLGRAPHGAGVAVDTDQVGDASRISPPRLAPDAARPTLTAAMTIEHGDFSLAELACTHPSAVRRDGAHRTIVTLQAGAAMDRDLVLRFRLDDGRPLGTQLVIAPDPSGDHATFQLTLVPPPVAVRTRPRRVVFVLDRSGSMAGWKMVGAARAVARMVDGLDRADRFAVFGFGVEVVASPQLPYDRLHAASARNRGQASEFVTGLVADGGTEMLRAIEVALAVLSQDDVDTTSGQRLDVADRWLVLVTDGQVANEDALVAAVARAGGVKVLAVGIDDAANSALLARLARASGGRVELVDSERELPYALDRLHLALSTPGFTQVELEGQDGLEIDAGSIVPTAPRHVFPGQPLVVRGRCRGHHGSIRVFARGARGAWSADVRAVRSAAAGVTAGWARERLLVLEDQYAAHVNQRAGLADQMVRTSLEFGVLCRMTAFVAVDPRAPRAVIGRQLAQPVEEVTPPAEPPSTMRGSTRTQAGTIVGTMQYLSPEQVRGSSVDARHRVFVGAVILCELLLGRSLWSSENMMETLQDILRGNLPTPLVPPAAAALEPILRRALQSDRDRRHGDPGELADELAAVSEVAAAADIAAWLRSAAPGAIDAETARARKIAATRAVRGAGWVTVDNVHSDEHVMLDVDVRASAAGPVEVALVKRLSLGYDDPERIRHMLRPPLGGRDGFVECIERGADARGAFAAYVYRPGLVLDDRSLRRAGPMPLAIALGIMVPALRALADADARRSRCVLSNDLQPSLLWLGLNGVVRWLGIENEEVPHSLTSAQLAARAAHRWVVVPRSFPLSTSAPPTTEPAPFWR